MTNRNVVALEIRPASARRSTKSNRLRARCG